MYLGSSFVIESLNSFGVLIDEGRRNIDELCNSEKHVFANNEKIILSMLSFQSFSKLFCILSLTSSNSSEIFDRYVSDDLLSLYMLISNLLKCSL